MSYLWVGYGLTWLALALYAWRLEQRRKAAERELSFHREQARGAPRGADAAGTGGSGPAAGDR